MDHEVRDAMEQTKQDDRTPALSSEPGKTKVLFVDDEPLILDGLRRILRPLRKEWDMTFVNCGEEALQVLEGGSFHVIVTDMRMPGMDGAQLLERVKDRFPEVIRLVLSGYFEREAAMRAAPVAHRFLAKPCEPKELREAIGSCWSLMSEMGDDDARRVVGMVGRLPSMPGHCSALMQALSNPDTALHQISGIVERDVALAAKVLQLVNSAFFGRSQQITNVPAAVSYLGLEVLKNLVLSAEIFQMFDARKGVPGFSMEGFQQHCSLAARIASRLPVAEPHRAAAVLAALLHDNGLLVLASHMPGQFGQAVSVSVMQDRPVYQIEQEMIGIGHGQVGAYLLGLWGLPRAIVDAVRRHHEPLADPSSRNALDVVSAVQIADRLAQELPAFGAAGYPSAHDAFGPAWEETAELAEWRRMAREVSQSATL